MDRPYVEWLVQYRSELQNELLALREVLRWLPRVDIQTADSKMAAWLVGAGFSLWRAVFLADVSTAPGRNIGEGEEFLDKVLLDQAILYRDDKNSWSFGYYINNARFRLLRAAKKVEPQTAALSEALDKMRLGLKGEENPAARAAYENAHEAFKILIPILKARVVSPNAGEAGSR